MDPADVPALKQHIVAVMSRFPIDVSDADDFSNFTLGAKPPGWWKPRQLPDADVLRDQSCWCVFSRQTGTVYVVWFEF